MLHRSLKAVTMSWTLVDKKKKFGGEGALLKFSHIQLRINITWIM